VRDAVDAAVSGATCNRTRADERAGADGEVVWSWHPDADAKFASDLADDGGKKARSPGRARRKPLKPSRRECRIVSVNLW
jgi:hypothetical protein